MLPMGDPRQQAMGLISQLEQKIREKNAEIEKLHNECSRWQTLYVLQKVVGNSWVLALFYVVMGSVVMGIAMLFFRRLLERG